MKPFSDYPTPLTDANAGYGLHHISTVPSPLVRDLERKLALCRDALAECLSELQDDGRTPLSSDGVEQAIAALDATK